MPRKASSESSPPRYPPRCKTARRRLRFNAHVDTSPETTGAGVKPQVVRSYDGRDLVLPGDPTKVIRVADNPELRSLVGQTIITTDGTTLLGADDKAGVAVIMELAAHLLEQRNLPHGPIRVLSPATRRSATASIMSI